MRQEGRKDGGREEKNGGTEKKRATGEEKSVEVFGT